MNLHCTTFMEFLLSVLCIHCFTLILLQINICINFFKLSQFLYFISFITNDFHVLMILNCLPSTVDVLLFFELLSVGIVSVYILLFKKICIGVEKVPIRLPIAAVKATKLKDLNFIYLFLKQAIYERLFSWIVGCINEIIALKKDSRSGKTTIIGVLDIYGFELFDNNR